jgi:protein-S-isoprenylcysteine O-methyltransferase Ste14
MIKTTRILDFRPPRIAFSLVLAAGIAHYLIPMQVLALPASTVGAIATGLTGFAIMIRAWWLFRLRGTAICPTAATSVLITDDIFAISRNPMYLGMVLMLLALAIFLGSLPFYAAALAMFVILNNAFCPYEEQKLLRSFTDDFAAYKTTVRRWL